MLADLLQQSSLPGEATNGPSQWQLWLTSSVKLLADASLLRSLHPVCTTLSPVEVKRLSYAGMRFQLRWCVLLLCFQVDLSRAALQEWLASIAGCSASAISMDPQVSAGTARKP